MEYDFLLPFTSLARYSDLWVENDNSRVLSAPDEDDRTGISTRSVLCKKDSGHIRRCLQDDGWAVLI